MQRNIARACGQCQPGWAAPGWFVTRASPQHGLDMMHLHYEITLQLPRQAALLVHFQAPPERPRRSQAIDLIHYCFACAEPVIGLAQPLLCLRLALHSFLSRS